MDPNANLEQQLELAGEILASADAASEEDRSLDKLIEQAGALAGSVLALHEWITNGGFLPREWNRLPAPAEFEDEDFDPRGWRTHSP